MRSIFCGACALLVLSCGLRAQQTIDKASLSGVVEDETGAVIVGGTVRLDQSQTGFHRDLTTDATGQFRLPYLAVGRYIVVAGAPGFALRREAVDLTAGATVHVILTLKAASAETATIDDVTAPVIDAERTQVAGRVSADEIENLPLLGRNFLDLALLVPGVSQTNTASTQLYAETSAVAGQGLSINSQRNFSNSFIVDGLSANDDAAGLVVSSFALDSIREMAVVTSNGQAEFGRAIGGYISFVTASGTNTLHGGAYGYLRNQRLNAANALAGRKLPLTQAQYGASLGGSLRHDRTFLFGNFEQKRLQGNGTVTITAANAAAIDARLQAVGYPGALLVVDPLGTTLEPNPAKTTNFFLRMDQHAGARDELSARYSLYQVASLNSRGVGGLSYPTAGAALYDLDQTVAASNVYTLNARTVNETRAQFTNSDLDAPVNDATGPGVTISGVAVFGTLPSSPVGRHDRLYEVVDNLSRQAGKHALRVGADFLFNDLSIDFPQTSRGSYAFSSLANFQKGVYTTFTQSFGNAMVPQTNPNAGVYVQDSWQASRSLNVNLGMRYDLDFLKAVTTDTNNISPRVGLAFSPRNDGRTVVRASFGLFFDRVPLRALSNALQSSGNTTSLTASTFTTLAFSYGQAGAPVFPLVDAGYTALTLPANLRVGLATLDPHLPSAQAQQASVEVDQQLGHGSHLALSYQHARGQHLLAIVNRNAAACAAAVDPVNLCRPVSAYASNRQYSGAGDSYYDGLAVSLEQRPEAWGIYRVSYTWSKALDDVGEFFFSAPVNNFFVGEDRSRSDDDQRHRLTVSGTAHTSRVRGGWLHGLEGAGSLTYTSRLPFNVVTGTQSVQQTALRPCAPGVTMCTAALPGTLIGRNAGVGFDLFTANARVGKTFWLGERLRVEGLAEGFNVLNHRNDMVPNGTFGTGSYPAGPAAGFGQATAVGDPRQVQLGVKVVF